MSRSAKILKLALERAAFTSDSSTVDIISTSDDQILNVEDAEFIYCDGQMSFDDAELNNIPFICNVEDNPTIEDNSGTNQKHPYEDLDYSIENQININEEIVYLENNKSCSPVQTFVDSAENGEKSNNSTVELMLQNNNRGIVGNENTHAQAFVNSAENRGESNSTVEILLQNNDNGGIVRNKKTSESSINEDLSEDSEADEDTSYKDSSHRKHEREVSKKNRMLGKEYKGYRRSNKIVSHDKWRPERAISASCTSSLCAKSTKRFCKSFSTETRKMLFKNFWNLSWDEKRVYVVNLLDIMDNKRATAVNCEAGDKSRRSNTIKYYLKLQGEKKEVCKKMFLGTLGLREWMVHNWIKKEVFTVEPSNTQPSSANDGNLKNRKKPLGERQTDLEMWIDNLPKLPSHYCRQSTKRLYLEGEFSSKADLYRLYEEWCAEKNLNKLSKTIFYDILKHKKVSIFRPRKDQCDECVSFKTGQISLEQYNSHISTKNRARHEKELDKEKALSNEQYVIAMDLQAVKLCPKTEASALYYSQRLKVHNFTMYNLATSDCTCYWWDESEGELTASIFTSMVIHFLETHCLADKKPVVIYSDGCGYQNRNAVLSNALLNFSLKNNIRIEQKYLTKGHTQMECDSVHSTIEQKLKGKEVHLPSDYVKYCKMARKKTKPYDTVYLDHTFFKNYVVPNQLYESIRPGRNTHDPEVKDIKALLYDPTESVIKYKLHFDDEYSPLPSRPKRKSATLCCGLKEYDTLYATRPKLTLTKYQDLQKLKKLLPHDTHPFYDNLPHETVLKDRNKSKI